MRKKFIVAAIAMTAVVAANLFVISAKEGNVKCQNLLSSSFLLNKIAYANDPGGSSNSHVGRREIETVSCENYANGQITEIRYTFSNTQAYSIQLKSDFSLEVEATAPTKWLDIQGMANAKWGANKQSENNMANSFSGVWMIDIRSASGVRVDCNGKNDINCIEENDPCSTIYERAYMKFLNFYYSN